MSFDRVAYNKKYREEHKDYFVNYNKQWLQDNKEHRQEYNKNWEVNNKDKRREYDRKRANNINRRLHKNLCTRIRAVLLGEDKSARTLEMLGCTVKEFRKYLESLFDNNMLWENYGTYWEIDHIKPCALFNLSDPNQQKECFHWSNMQPLEVRKNRSKQDTFPYISKEGV